MTTEIIANEDKRTVEQKIADDKKNIPFLYRFARNAYESVALKVISYGLGFIVAETALIGFAASSIDNDHTIELARAEAAAAKNHGMVTMYNTTSGYGKKEQYIPAEGEGRTMSLAEAKDEILHPKIETTPGMWIKGIFVLGLVGVAGAAGAHKLLNGAAEIGNRNYYDRVRNIENKYDYQD